VESSYRWSGDGERRGRRRMEGDTTMLRLLNNSCSSSLSPFWYSLFPSPQTPVPITFFHLNSYKSFFHQCFSTSQMRSFHSAGYIFLPASIFSFLTFFSRCPYPYSLLVSHYADCTHSKPSIKSKPKTQPLYENDVNDKTVICIADVQC